MGAHGLAEREADAQMRATRWFLFAAILSQVAMLVYTSGGASIDKAMVALVLFIVVTGSFALGILVERYK